MRRMLWVVAAVGGERCGHVGVRLGGGLELLGRRGERAAAGHARSRPTSARRHARRPAAGRTCRRCRCRCRPTSCRRARRSTAPRASPRSRPQAPPARSPASRSACPRARRRSRRRRSRCPGMGNVDITQALAGAAAAAAQPAARRQALERDRVGQLRQRQAHAHGLLARARPHRRRPGAARRPGGVAGRQRRSAAGRSTPRS